MEVNNTIDHQLLDSNHFLPSWEIKTLVLGTFNPSCGEKVDYFYGRCMNNFWRICEEIYNLDYMYFQNQFDRKLNFMIENQFGCTDIIKKVQVYENINVKEICGSGYSDQILFTAKKCTLEYNFKEIKSLISNSNITTVINTWGKRESPKSFLDEINDLELYCISNNIQFIRKCPSPSGRLRSKDHKAELYNFYKKHIFKK